MIVGTVSLNDFFDRLGSSDPTPGGGALAAVVGASASAMLAMTCNFTIGRPRYADVEVAVQGLLTEVLHLRQRLMELADEDAAAYGAVRDAYQLARSTEAEKGARAAAIEASMHGATSVPLETMACSHRLIELSEAAARLTNVNTLGDVAVAAHIATGATRAAADQARLNLGILSDADFVAASRARIAAATTDIDDLVRTAVATVDARTNPS